jgi:O-methyltransferase
VPNSSSIYGSYYSRLLKRASMAFAKGIAFPYVRRDAVRSGAYGLTFPLATYSPWDADGEFAAIYQHVRRYTLVDMLRLYELWALLAELVGVPGSILEVGVWRGGSGAMMAARAADLGITDPVYLADTWEGVVKTSDVDTHYSGGEHDDTSRGTVETLISQLGLRNVELLQGIFPEQTAEPISDRTLRLCHIDVDVYQSAADVFAWAWPRLSVGGVVVFDDYGFPTTPGVTKFVDEQRGLPDRLVIHNLNGHGLVIKYRDS